ncbi:MAG: carbohydrate ABC transporter permease [Mycoplasmatales bacterium]
MKKFKFKKRLNRSISGDIPIFLIIFCFGLFSIWPMIFSFSNALKPFEEIFIFPPTLFVKNPTLNNFSDLASILTNSWVPFSRYLFNTVFITIVGTVGHVILASMAAYPLAKYKFPGSKLLFNIVVFSLMFTPVVTEIPNYIIVSKLGLIDTYWAIILPALAFSLGLYLMKQFMEQVPLSLLESAKLDGANEFVVFWKVVMPNVKPAWLTLTLLIFQTFWSATGGNFIYSENMKTITYALGQIVNTGIARTGVASAVTIIIMAVPIIIFIATQSNIMETMSSSGMKE